MSGPVPLLPAVNRSATALANAGLRLRPELDPSDEASRIGGHFVEGVLGEVAKLSADEDTQGAWFGLYGPFDSSMHPNGHGKETLEAPEATRTRAPLKALGRASLWLGEYTVTKLGQFGPTLTEPIRSMMTSPRSTAGPSFASKEDRRWSASSSPAADGRP